MFQLVILQPQARPVHWCEQWAQPQVVVGSLEPQFIHVQRNSETTKECSLVQKFIQLCQPCPYRVVRLAGSSHSKVMRWVKKLPSTPLPGRALPTLVCTGCKVVNIGALEAEVTDRQVGLLVLTIGEAAPKALQNTMWRTSCIPTTIFLR